MFDIIVTGLKGCLKEANDEKISRQELLSHSKLFTQKCYSHPTYQEEVFKFNIQDYEDHFDNNDLLQKTVKHHGATKSELFDTMDDLKPKAKTLQTKIQIIKDSRFYTKTKKKKRKGQNEHKSLLRGQDSDDEEGLNQDTEDNEILHGLNSPSKKWPLYDEEILQYV